MDKWDARFVELATLVATWSKDESTKVGAVIVDSKKRVVSVGFNGYPRGIKDGPHDRDKKLLRTMHAEANAISFAKSDVAGCTIYVTHHPCAHCAAQIIQAGVGRVVYPKDADGRFSDRWKDNISEARNMLDEAGVSIHETDGHHSL